jgi:hypothetical protein
MAFVERQIMSENRSLRNVNNNNKGLSGFRNKFNEPFSERPIQPEEKKS